MYEACRSCAIPYLGFINLCLDLYIILTAIFSAEDGPAVSEDFSVVPTGGYRSLLCNEISAR